MYNTVYIVHKDDIAINSTANNNIELQNLIKIEKWYL